VIKSMDIDINQLSFYADSEYGQIIAWIFSFPTKTEKYG
jgi:hypothetical protein